MTRQPITQICFPGVVGLVRSNLGTSFPLFHGFGVQLVSILGVFHPAPLVRTDNKALYNASTC